MIVVTRDIVVKPTRSLVVFVVGLLVSCLVVVIAYSPILFLGNTLSTAGTGRAAGTNGEAPFPGQKPNPPEDFRTDAGASAWQPAG